MNKRHFKLVANLEDRTTMKQDFISPATAKEMADMWFDLDWCKSVCVVDCNGNAFYYKNKRQPKSRWIIEFKLEGLTLKV